MTVEFNIGASQEKLTMRLNVGGMLRARRWLYLATDKGDTFLLKAEGGPLDRKRLAGLLVPSLTFSVDRNGL